MLELENGARQTLRDDGEFGLYRVRCGSTAHGRVQPALLVAPLREHTAPRSLRRLEHEYALRGELDSAWAVVPLGLLRHRGRPVLVLEDPGGEPLERLVGAPLELRRFLRVAIGLTVALGQVHR